MRSSILHGIRPRLALGAVAAVSLLAAVYAADDLVIVHPVSSANQAPNTGAGPFTEPNRIASNFTLSRIAQGSDPLENPSGVITNFGLLSDGTRTEPDENTYVVLDHNPGGPTPGYHYGRHFLFQGHENSNNLAYVTRINLDVTDPAHRITLLTPTDAISGKTSFNSIDGSVWNPFTRTMLFTQESGSLTGAAIGGVVEVSSGWPATVTTLYGEMGRAGYEGIRSDDNGDIWMVEDTGGTGVSLDPADTTNSVTPKAAKQPNSFIYRFQPYDKTDLSVGGRLYALQVWIGGRPLVFNAADPHGDAYSTKQLALHTVGAPHVATWVLLHDTAVDGTVAFDSAALAKAKKATPFKRPENGAFRPGSRFNTFFFDTTGDTDARAGAVPELAARGSWGALFRLDFPFGNMVGTLRAVYVGDADHAGFDNVTFADGETLLAAEDRGDTLHDQLNALDSVWAFDVIDGDFAPRRLIALGRDAVSAPAGGEDNEPTGLVVSDGSASVRGLLGTNVPRLDADRDRDDHGRDDRGRDDHDRDDHYKAEARMFVTQQHGLNQVFEILKTR